MKTKKVSKRLYLNKETITSLDHITMKDLNGGATYPPGNSCNVCLNPSKDGCYTYSACGSCVTQCSCP